MADIDWEFVFDGVVGFLSSPLWQLPIMDFIEANCIVFDPSEENCLPWSDTHKLYKTLVENLLSSYLKDIGLNEEHFVHACGSQSLQNRPQLQGIFEQIWAAEDFEIFKQMMIQRNIELELQALQLIKQQQQHRNKQSKEPSKAVNRQPEEEKGSGVDCFEDEILQEVIRRSKEEYEALVAEKEHEASEIEKHYSESHDTNVKILKDKAEEKRQEMKKVVADRVISSGEVGQSGSKKTSEEQAPPVDKVTSSKATSSKATAQPSVLPVKSNPPSIVEPTAVDAATSWLACAKAEAANETKVKPSSSLPSTEKDDLKQRELYLKEQRDRLLKLKNKEREKQLNTYTASQTTRPTSARIARKAVTGSDAGQANDPEDTKKLAVRKALADKLKKEIIYK